MTLKRFGISALSALGFCLVVWGLPQLVQNGKLYNNGPADGSGAYSNMDQNVTGFRRTLLDDFVVTVPAWIVRDLSWTHIWSTQNVPVGTGAEIEIRADNIGTPGAVIATASLTSYAEVPTGSTYFGQSEMRSTAGFSEIVLPTGVYSFEATVVGPEADSWLTNQQEIKGNECWVNYEDFNGLESGTSQFGFPANLNFVLGGVSVVAADDFESGGLIKGGWARENKNARVTPFDPYEGQFCLELKDTTWVETSFDAIGFGTLTVEFAHRQTNYGPGEFLFVEYWDQTQWVPAGQFNDTNWTVDSVNMPPGIGLDFRLRFRTNAPPAPLPDVVVTPFRKTLVDIVRVIGD